ncbi:hypothetical protein E4U24_003123 [Claviceps purpurea]|nr:hypothetical protein E4U10_002561 [Claviceps purpurea]KAG6247538.1 hypothetical protein E4U24_003123 [Claviceps purpurea]
MAENLHRVVSRYMCDDDGDIEQPKGSKADLHFNEQGDLVTDDGNDRPESLQQQFKPRVYATLADFFQQLQAPLQITQLREKRPPNERAERRPEMERTRRIAYFWKRSVQSHPCETPFRSISSSDGPILRPFCSRCTEALSSHAVNVGNVKLRRRISRKYSGAMA